MIFTDFLLEEYCIKNSLEIPQYLIDLEKETNLRTTMPQMLSGRLQGRMLSFLSRLMSPSKILELGTFTGYSALCLAEGLKENGCLTTIEMEKEYEGIIRKYIQISPYEDRIKLVFADALTIIKDLDEIFDLVFIDAYKIDYKEYYNKILPNVRKGGLIIVDNVLWSGKVVSELEDKTAFALDEFNDYIRNDQRVDNVMIPVRDGIMLIWVK